MYIFQLSFCGWILGACFYAALSIFKLRSTFLLFYFPVCLLYLGPLMTRRRPAPSSSIDSICVTSCVVADSPAGRSLEKSFGSACDRREGVFPLFLSSESAGRTRLGRWVGTSRDQSALRNVPATRHEEGWLSTRRSHRSSAVGPLRGRPRDVTWR